MQEDSRYVTGIDIGTTTVRCVVAHISSPNGTPKIVGVGVAPNSGMRKGIISNLNGPATAIDNALASAERMSGHQVTGATISVNGSHITSMQSKGTIAVSSDNQEVTEDDILRVKEVATVGKVPVNREILQIIPHEYKLDDQPNIKDPIGMAGTRLEVDANIVSGLTPYIGNVHKVADMTNIIPHDFIPASLASAHAVLNESQKENGVALVDIGGATTGVVVFEEGDLQHISVIPMGGNNVTNDMAIGLKVDPEIAEKVKLQHAKLIVNQSEKTIITVRHDKANLTFERQVIQEIVEARYEEIFEAVEASLKKSGHAGKLPSGIVLTGGGAKIDGIIDFVKERLALAVRVGLPSGPTGISEQASGPEFATAVGLMLIDATPDHSNEHDYSHKNTDNTKKRAGNWLSGLADKFR